MEVYTLDSLLRRVTVTDNFDSMIWTERYSASGDFQLVIKSTQQFRALFTTGTLLAINESYRVMQIQSVTSAAADDGTIKLTIVGPSIEDILSDRIAKDALANSTTDPAWVIDGLPAPILRSMFNQICVLGNLSAGDIIPLISTANPFPADTIAEPTDSVSLSIKPTTLYSAMKTIADQYNLGFRFTRGLDNSILYFNIYSGSDRTTDQTVLPAVVFSSDLDNLADVSELSDTSNYNNVALVVAAADYIYVYSDGADSTIAGFNRRVLFVDGSSLTTDPATGVAYVAGASLTAAMTALGVAALAKQRVLQAFDGEIPQNSQYKYGTDYNLGDLVEMRNEDGVANQMRVTEQIFVSDDNGERSYPTLAVNLLITPGSWLAWDGNQDWADVDPTENWADLT